MEVHIGARGEIVIPKKLREEHGIKPNTTVRLVPTADGLTLQTRKTADAVEEWNERIRALPKLKISDEQLKRILQKEPYEDED